MRIRVASSKKQISFTTAQSLTSVARQIASAEKKAVQRKLENSTPFTINSVGAAHKLNDQALLNPRDIKLNKYSNLPRNKLSQLKAKPNVFSGDIDGANCVAARVKARKGHKGKKHSENCMQRVRVKNPMPKLLIRFGNVLPVKPMLDIWIAQRQWQRR